MYQSCVSTKQLLTPFSTFTFRCIKTDVKNMCAQFHGDWDVQTKRTLLPAYAHVDASEYFFPYPRQFLDLAYTIFLDDIYARLVHQAPGLSKQRCCHFKGRGKKRNIRDLSQHRNHRTNETKTQCQNTDSVANGRDIYTDSKGRAQVWYIR